jgi:large subunit ribosomal protein L29
MTKIQELRDQSVEELKALSHDLSREIFAFRNEVKVTRKVEKPHLLREKKRTRARVLTLLRQKETAVTG